MESLQPRPVTPSDDPCQHETRWRLVQSNENLTVTAPSKPEESKIIAYPPPNGPTSDTGIWLTVGSSRFWCRDLVALKAKKKELDRLKNKSRRRTKRRHARRTERELRRSASQHIATQNVSLSREPSSVQIDVHRSRQPSSLQGSSSPPTRTTWLHVTGFSNETTEAQVRSYVSKKIRREDVVCNLLPGQDSDHRERPLLSFKIRVPTSVVYIVLDRSFWSSGIRATKMDFHAARQERSRSLNTQQRRSEDQH